MDRHLTIASLLFFAVPCHAQRGTGAAGASSRPSAPVEVPSAALEAGGFQSTWGMSAGDLYRYHFGGSLAAAPEAASGRQGGATRADSTQLVIAPEGMDAVKGTARTEDGKLDAGLPAPKRGLFDAPGPIPLPKPPPPPGPGPLQRIGSAIRGSAQIGAATVTPAPNPGEKLIDNLRLPPAVQPAALPGATPENAANAGGADFSRRVIGERTLPPSVPGAAQAAVQPHPLPVLVEVKLSPGFGDPVAAIEKQAGVVVDRSFPTFFSSSGRQTAFVRAWADPDRLIDLTLHPAVARLAVVSGAAPSVLSPGVSVPVALHLRLPQAERIDAFLTRSVTALEDAAGFKWRVARGYQLYPTPYGTTVVMTGELPAASIDRLLAYGDLVRIEPYVAAERPGEAAPAAAAASTAAAPAKPAAPVKRGPNWHAAKGATDLVVLSTAYPWMGIMMREIYFWIDVALF